MRTETPLLLFALATLAGGAFATMSVGRRPLPLVMAVVQELLSIIAFVVLLITVVSTAQPPLLLVMSLGLFAAAATGSVALFVFHLHHRALPRPLAYLHAVGTSSGYLCLAAAVLAA